MATDADYDTENGFERAKPERSVRSSFRVCSCSQAILTVTGWETGQETVTVLLR